MTLQDFGSIGSFVAAQSVLESLNEAIQSAASTPQLARVVALGQTDYEQLSEDERQQFLIWLFGWFRIIEQAHHNYVLGHFETRIWNGYARHIRSVMQAPAVRRWWKFRKSVFSPEFQHFIDGLDDDPSVVGLAGVLEGMRSDERPPN